MKWILTILAFFIVATGSATETETPKMKVSKLEPEKALVAFNSVTPTNFEILLTKNKNDVVYFYKSKSKKQSYRKTFDFSDLKEGDYNLCINYGNKSLNSKIVVSEDGITTGPVFNLFEPYFQFENQKLKISFLNITQKKVSFNVYKDNKIVSGFNIGKDFCIHKCFDFSELEGGDYKVVVTDKFKDHIYFVSK